MPARRIAAARTIATSRIVQGAYWDKLYANARSAQIGWWPLDDAVGSATILDYSPQGNNAVPHANLILGADGIGDGHSCAYFNGTAAVNLYSPAFAADFDGNEGAICAWACLQNAAQLSSGVSKNVVRIERGTQDSALISVDDATNKSRHAYVAGNVGNTIIPTFTIVTWFHMALTWSLSEGIWRGWTNGAQVGTDQPCVTPFVGPVADNHCMIGGKNSFAVPVSPFIGRIAHARVFNRPLTAAEVLVEATLVIR